MTTTRMTAIFNDALKCVRQLEIGGLSKAIVKSVAKPLPETSERKLKQWMATADLQHAIGGVRKSGICEHINEPNKR